jgi:hypothetical protein
MIAVRKGPFLALALAGALATLGCADEAAAPAIERRLVVEWLTCIDCHPDQLNVILSAAIGAPDSVVAMLRRDLENGPDAATFASLDSASDRSFRRLTTTVAPPGFGHVAWRPNNALVFQARHRLLASRTWRMRAAIALARIGTRSAVQALDGACPGLTDTVEVETVALARLSVDATHGACWTMADSLHLLGSAPEAHAWVRP